MKALSFLLFCCLFCGSALIADTNISGVIGTSQTWTLAGSPYIITGNVEVYGPSTPIVTIEAGVQVRINAGASITLGHYNYSNRRGGMIVNGTEGNPVLFTANTTTPTAGYWNFIRSHTYTAIDNNAFSHAILEYGGSGEIGMFNVMGGNPSFANCTFRYSSNYGIYHGASNVTASVSGCSFENNGSYPLYWNPQFVSSIGEGNTFSGNFNQRILLRSNTLTVAETWNDKGVPFEMENDLTLENDDDSLILQPGTQVLFRNGKRLVVGHASYSTSAGSINASSAILGAVDPILGWNGVLFQNYTQPSILSSCTIRDVNSVPPGSVTINCNTLANLQDCLITDNNNYAVYCYAGKSFTLSGCTISGNAKTVGIYAADIPKLLTGNSYTGNSENRIRCLGGNITASANWTTQSTPIWVTEDITQDNPGIYTLQIPAGTELQFDSGRGFYIGSTVYSSNLPCLSATGVIFKASDAVIGWNGIFFRAHISPSNLASCTIRDVATSSGGAVTINCFNLVTLQNCLFTNNGTFAVTCNSGRNFAMSGCTLSGNAKTVSIYACDMQKLLTGNSYTGNSENHIQCFGGTIANSATWTTQSTPIWVTADIILDAVGAPVLNIPYGTELQFAGLKYFSVGNTSYSDHIPVLNATGVIFRGVESTPGYWTGLIFRYRGGNSLLSGCTIRDAGYNNAAAINCSITNSTITGCTVQNCLAIGIYLADNSIVALSGNTVTTCGSYPLSIYAEKLRALTGQNQFTGNTIDRVQVRAGDIGTSGTWYNPGVPYQLTGSCQITTPGGSPHIKIMPGAVIMLPDGAALYIGNNSYSANLGSLEAESVTFTRSSEAAVPAGLVFYRYSTMGASHFTGCVFEYLQRGSSLSAVYVDYNDPVFESCVFRNNPAQGLVVTSTGRASAIDCQFLDNGGYPISTTATAFDAVSGTGNYFTGNNPNRILISGGTLAQNYTWDNPSVPVEVTSHISVDALNAQPILKVNSGLVLLFRSGVGFYVGNATYSDRSGGLQADGATFSALNGTLGGWAGITFYRYARNDSYLSGCVIEYAGGNGNIYLNNSALAYIDGCVIRYGTYGVNAYGSLATPSISKNYILSNGVGVYCTNSANPIISGSLGNANSIDGNTSYGVQNTTSSLNVNALYNWWGDASGPYHATLNPGGLGDDVSNWVNFDPWRTTEIGDAPARFHLLSPANSSLIETLMPVLDWEEAIDPTPGDTVAYTLLIAGNSGFTSGLITVPDLTATVYHVPDDTLDDDTRYYWKVSATDDDGQITWAYENYFWFDTAVPEYPLPFALSSPVDYATVHLTSNLLAWQASSDPDPGDTITYTVYWDVSAGFENPGSLTTTASSIYSGFCAPGSLIYWKVKAFDSTGRETFSPIWRFFVHPDAKPRAPVYFTLTPIGSNMLVEWDAVPGADTYDLYFSTEPYSGFSLLQAGVTTPEYLHLGAASGPTGFYYVKALDMM